jgi:hypothetical protein
MPWKRKGKTVYKKSGGKWMVHQTYKSVTKAVSALKYLRAKHGH